MSLSLEKKNHLITHLLNGTQSSLKKIVPIPYKMSKPRLLEETLELQFGVLIGFTGDLKGKLILTGEQTVFGVIGKAMFGMEVEGEMLASFSGELGNMIAGNLSTNIVDKGIQTDITAPTIMQGSTKLFGHNKAISLKANFENTGDMDIYLLLD